MKDKPTDYAIFQLLPDGKGEKVYSNVGVIVHTENISTWYSKSKFN